MALLQPVVCYVVVLFRYEGCDKMKYTQYHVYFSLRQSQTCWKTGPERYESYEIAGMPWKKVGRPSCCNNFVSLFGSFSFPAVQHQTIREVVNGNKKIQHSNSNCNRHHWFDFWSVILCNNHQNRIDRRVPRQGVFRGYG